MRSNRYEDVDATGYERVRPSYPPAAIEAILTAADEPRTVVDIGAGTGKFARQLARLAPQVTVEAIEPASAMRESWKSHPRITLRSGTSESTGLPAHSADRVVWAQSFHWVDREESGKEARRILRPGGVGAVLVNQMDVSRPWVHRLTRIMRSGDVIKETWHPTLPTFETKGPQVFRWSQKLTVDEVLALGRTRSSYLGSSGDRRKKMQENLHWYLTEHLGYERVEIPYVTYLWLLY